MLGAVLWLNFDSEPGIDWGISQVPALEAWGTTCKAWDLLSCLEILSHDWLSIQMFFSYGLYTWVFEPCVQGLTFIPIRFHLVSFDSLFLHSEILSAPDSVVQLISHCSPHLVYNGV